ncbi:MAG: TM2 domain-containing protein [Rhodospirillales bacterium]|nr:TM2 domain-containing protein [Rhodospirillales bacterium]
MEEPFPGAPEKSPKSYGLAVALCGIFGVIGVHHFYIGNWLHGLLDFGLFVAFVVLLGAEMDGAAYSVLAVDALHTIYVFYHLIVGTQQDGQGRLISWK